MRIALISDLHGNAVALDAVLADIARVGVDRIACLGDVANLGVAPVQVVETLESLGCVCIQGNHDAFLLQPELVHTYTEAPVIVESVAWCRERLSAAHLAFLASFRESAELELAPGVRLLLFHGSPRSNVEDLLATTPPDDVDALLAGQTATAMAFGHTHIQMLRQHRGTLLVNPGSVGVPFLEHVGGRQPVPMGHAEYATMETQHGGVAVALRRVAVDADAAKAQALASDHPLRQMWAHQYR